MVHWFGNELHTLTPCPARETMGNRSSKLPSRRSGRGAGGEGT